MTVNKPASHRTLGSDMARVDAHQIQPHEYQELPELTDEALAQAIIRKGGRPRAQSPRQLISLRLPPEVIEKSYGLDSQPKASSMCLHVLRLRR
jgi:uncharacterized protein (DUF4415 family)